MNDIMRREVMAKFGGRCSYCGRRKARTVDHIKPMARAGCDWPDNLLPSCKDCNNAKGDMTVEQFRMALFQCRFGRMPFQKTAKSAAGRRWVKLAARFPGDKVTFFFEQAATNRDPVAETAGS
jgi:5-methylcytosine-specific restriction endonuclease McrA